MKYEEALDNIKNSYDAFFIQNKYGDNGTHDEEFKLLASLPELNLEKGALCWIKYEYDCYYKDSYADEKDTAFEYIRNICKKYDSKGE